jgi:hypothetical protein
MKRIRIEKPNGRRERSWLEALPLDPRDPAIVRAKSTDRTRDRQSDRPPVHARERDRRR